MFPIINSSARGEDTNPQLKEEGRKRGESNLEWLNRHLKEIKNGFYLILLGGNTPVDFRLRIAQSHLKHDLSPSSWSHVILIGELNKELGKTLIYEISLEPENGFGYPPPENGLQTNPLKKFKSPKTYPNIALISLPLSNAKLLESLETFKMQRAAIDTLDLILRWLGFAWGVGKTSNPILDGYGFPSAVMIEVIVSALGFELTPGIPSSASCPEAIWQSIKWWHKFYEEQSSQVSGYYFRPHEIK